MDTRQRIAEQESALSEKDARIQELQRQRERLIEQVAALTEQVAVLTERLERDSRNSHLPPSSSPPGRAGRQGKAKNQGEAKRKRKPKRKRGGQVGHSGAHRALLPEDRVTDFVDVFPQQCENCWKALPAIPDPKAKRYQVTEVPPFSPSITEYQRHAVTCACGHTTRVPYDKSQIPASSFGPRLMSLVVLLTGVYHVSRRKTAQLLSDMVGVRISLGSISAIEARVSSALKPAVAEAWDQVESAEVKHTDGTSWLKAGVALSVWTLASTAATVFKIVVNSSRATLRPLYGALEGILVSDRAKALGFWAMKRRQVCWAHLLRKFVWFSERDGPVGAFGHDLLDYTGILFEYWHDYKNGKLDQRTFRAWMRPVREQVEALLERGVAANIARFSGSCADILAHRDALWTFVDHELVEPTNNHAERELRAFVLWRKRSFGTQSDRGNLFAERVMTVAHTARKQRKDILAFLTACCEERDASLPVPSLFDAGVAARA